MADLYNIVIRGRAITGWDDQEVKENLAKIFKEPPEKMDRLLSGKQVTVKKSIDHEFALRIIEAIEKAGAECKIVKQKTTTSKELVMEEKDKPESKPVVDKGPDKISKSRKPTRIDPYKTPKANLAKNKENNSGQGKDIELPDGVKGWSWGAFLLNWIWSIGNKTWIGFFSLIPYVGFVFAIVLGIKGRQWAWQNKHWDSVEHFQRVQKKWSFWAVVILVVPAIIGIIAAILIPMFISHRQM